MAKKKIRADQRLYELGLAESAEKATRLVMAGLVYEERKGQQVRIEKPGQQVSAESFLEVKGMKRFVSRGAYKLLTAIDQFGISCEGKVALDVGASTGGFTDCLLQHGASRVYAVDVGYGQLDGSLRNDPRVVNLERTNMRLAQDDLIPELVDMIVADVSFISLLKVIAPSMRFLKPGGEIAVLIKPQFEVSSDQTVKGVVRDDALRKETVARVIGDLERVCGLEFIGEIPSQIKGPKGNQEHIVYMRRPQEQGE